jgi:hypothetical protein
MTPNRRLPCSARQRSACDAQKTENAKRLKTLTHTKKTREVKVALAPPVGKRRK